MRRLPVNSKSLIPLVVLDTATPATVTALLGHVPEYGPREWRRLVENTVGAIHQIPSILRSGDLPNLDLKDIEAYFGRSSCGAELAGQNLYGRFRAGVDRGHMFGMVFAKTTIDATLQFERFGISLVNQLKRVDGLCISNRTLAARGNVGNTEPGYLYLTFALVEGAGPGHVLTQSQIDAAVAGVLGDLGKSSVVDVKPVHQEAARAAVTLANNVEYVGEHTIALAR